MILSAEALDILAYLKTAPGKFVSLQEISRRAGGRRRFEESSTWAKNQMPIILEAGLIEVNARGHYCVPTEAPAEKPPQRTPPAPRKTSGKTVGDDYFPLSETPRIVEGDYFPTTD